MADSIKVICDNLGGPIRVAMGTPLSDVAARLTPGRYPFLAAFVNNRIKELNYKIYTPVTVRFVDITDFAGIRVYQRTSWFILQKAARTLFPGHTLHIRHSMGQSGFYCELEGLDEFTHEQAAALEGHMREVVAQNLPIERTKVLTSELRAIYAEQGFDDKTALLDTRPRLYSDLYTLDGTAGYFYGALAPSTGYVGRFCIAPYYKGFYLAIDLAKKVGSDLILGTDPDSDRVGVMVRGADGEYHTITGNQMGVLLLDYIITAHIRKGTLPENAAALSTIVTSKMVRRICDVNNIHFEETFTGFKFMAEKLAEYQRDGSYQYLLAFEESYGYMMGDYVRDKDAVTDCVMITEMAAYYFEQGMTLAQALDALYEKYGFYGERTLNLVMPGLDGLEKMRALMAQLRREPLQEIAGTKVVRMRDYQDGSVYVMGLGRMDKTPISGSNVLYFELDDGCAFIVRPSGTEPKIKVYILGIGATRPECDERVQRYAQFAETLRG